MQGRCSPPPSVCASDCRVVEAQARTCRRGVVVHPTKAKQEASASPGSASTSRLEKIHRYPSTFACSVESQAGERLLTLAGSLRHHKKEKTSKFFLDSLSICRGDFAKALLNKASKVPNVNVHFGCTFSKVDMEQR